MASWRRVLVYRSACTCPAQIRPATSTAASMPAEPPPAMRPTERFRLRRLIPLAAIAMVAILVVAMGWHRELSLENLVRYRDRARRLCAARMALRQRSPPSSRSISRWWRFRFPGAAVPHGSGGILFGTLAGAIRRSIVAPPSAQSSIFLIARPPSANIWRGGPARWRRGWPKDFARTRSAICCSCGLVPAFRSLPSILLRRWPECGSATFVARRCSASCPATFALRLARRRHRQRDHRAGDRVSRLRRRRPRRTASSISISKQRSRRNWSRALVALGALALIPVAAKRMRARRAASPSG